MTVRVPLSRGKFALIDDCDAERVLAFNWTAMVVRQHHWYAVRGVYVNGKRKTCYLHRFILEASDSAHVDHRNGNGLDCRRQNIRAVTPLQNAWNRRKRRNGANRFIGVRPNGGKYGAQVWHSGTSLFLGQFVDEEQAARVYDAAIVILRGEFAHTNFPEVDATAKRIAEARLIQKRVIEERAA